MIVNGSVTLYNRFLDKTSREYKYKRTILKDVYTEQGEAIAVRTGTSIRPDDKAFVIIHAANQDAHVLPKDFDGSTGWTLKVEDIIVLHEVSDQIVSAAELQKKYDDVFTITAVALFNAGSSRMHHWEVTAK